INFREILCLSTIHSSNPRILSNRRKQIRVDGTTALEMRSCCATKENRGREHSRTSPYARKYVNETLPQSQKKNWPAHRDACIAVTNRRSAPRMNYAWRVLPGLFAFPAGFGDMATGVTAPWIVLGLVRNPSFAASRRYVIWNILGILDFVVAV